MLPNHPECRSKLDAQCQHSIEPSCPRRALYDRLKFEQDLQDQKKTTRHGNKDNF